MFEEGKKKENTKVEDVKSKTEQPVKKDTVEVKPQFIIDAINLIANGKFDKKWMEVNNVIINLQNSLQK